MAWLQSQSPTPPWANPNFLRVALPILFMVGVTVLRFLKAKAEERNKQKRASNLQRDLELEAIRTGRGIEQVLQKSGSGPESQNVTVVTDMDDPKVRRERQLAELRRRAAARSQGGTVEVRTAGSPTGPSQSIPAQARPVQFSSVTVQPSRQTPPRSVQRPVQAPPPRPVQRPPQKQQKPQRFTAEQARQLEQRRAAERQPVPTREANPYVSDVLEASDTHRLVGDSEAAKVTARQERRGPNLGRAGIRQAVIMSEILGKPRSERMDEI